MNTFFLPPHLEACRALRSVRIEMCPVCTIVPTPHSLARLQEHAWCLSESGCQVLASVVQGLMTSGVPPHLNSGFIWDVTMQNVRLRRYVSVTINCEADSLSTNTNMLEAAQVPECFCNYLLGKNYKTKQNIIYF